MCPRRYRDIAKWLFCLNRSLTYWFIIGDSLNRASDINSHRNVRSISQISQLPIVSYLAIKHLHLENLSTSDNDSDRTPHRYRTTSPAKSERCPQCRWKMSDWECFSLQGSGWCSLHPENILQKGRSGKGKVHSCQYPLWSHSQLTRLEYYWGMAHESLNVDTQSDTFRGMTILHISPVASRLTCFLVGGCLRHLFDEAFWMLIPEDVVVERFHKSLRRHRGEWYADPTAFPIFKVCSLYHSVRLWSHSVWRNTQEETFNYSLVPIANTMKEITIARQADIEVPERPSDVTVHVYPFRTLPLLKSHLHPKFSILNAGYKLKKLRGIVRKFGYGRELLQMLLNCWPFLKKIERIYQAWTRPLPRRAIEK